MRSYDGTPTVCAGSDIHGLSEFPIRVDQAPVMVREMLDGADGLVEFSCEDVAVYIAADARITAITPIYKPVAVAKGLR